MPDALPVLPVRETVVFPLTISPVSVDRLRSRKLVEEVTAGNRLVALVALRETAPGPPRPEDLYAFGTAALLHETLQGPESVLRVAVQGMERVADHQAGCARSRISSRASSGSRTSSNEARSWTLSCARREPCFCASCRS